MPEFTSSKTRILFRNCLTREKYKRKFLGNIFFKKVVVVVVVFLHFLSFSYVLGMVCLRRDTFRLWCAQSNPVYQLSHMNITRTFSFCYLFTPSLPPPPFFHPPLSQYTKCPNPLPSTVFSNSPLACCMGVMFLQFQK